MEQAVRIDRLLVYLRFARTRNRAQAMIEEGHLRLNGMRVLRNSEGVRVGDILTFPQGEVVRIAEVLALPARRGSPEAARSHYRELDRDGESAIAAIKLRDTQGDSAT
ncbi:MAG TPA: S4 domain-containing protein [Erythrobacter sp.]|nr:S4 domain-containing protein [Erythrobacter sp.]